MMNLSRFSKMSFTELVSLPNYYIHEIYKLYVDDYKDKRKKEEEEAKERAKKEREEARLNQLRDSSNVSSLRQMLASQGMNSSDFEDMLEELEDEA